VGVRVAPPQHLDDVVDGRAVERRDDADLARQRRQRALAPLVEQPLFGQARLQLLERQLPRAQPLGLELLADDLVLTLRVVDAHAAAGDDPEAVLRLELQVAQRRAEHHRLDLRLGVLQREVEMPGVPEPAVGDLAFDPRFEELFLEQRADLAGQLGDGEHAP
jgi:hypothetical protein